MTTISKTPSSQSSSPIQIPDFFERAFIKLLAVFKRAESLPSQPVQSSPYVIDFGKLEQIEEENALYEEIVRGSTDLIFLQDALNRHHAELNTLREEYFQIICEPTKGNLQRGAKIYPQIEALKLLVSETERAFKVKLRFEAKARGIHTLPIKHKIAPTDLKIRDQFKSLAREIHSSANEKGMETRKVAVLSLPLFANKNDLANLQNALQTIVK